MARSEGSLKQHLIAFFSGGVLSLTRLAMGFMRIKYVALALGTAGVGFISQAGQTQLLLVSLGSLSMVVGVITRMGALTREPDPERESRLLATALTVQLATSVLLVGIALIGSGFLSELLFTNEAATARVYLPLVLLGVPFSVVATGYAEGVLFGAHRYDLYVRSSLFTAVLSATATVVMVTLWGLPGAFLGILAASVIHCTSSVTYALKVRSFRQLFRLGFDLSEARALIKFCFVMIVTGASSYLARLWIQSRVIGDLGVEANGLLHVPLALTSYYTPLLSNPLWGRLHPSVSRTGDTSAGHRELSTALCFTAALTTGVIVSVLAVKEILVRVAYSAAFMPATRLLPVQLFGDLFYFVGLTFGVYFLGVGKLRIYLAAWIGYYTLSAIASTLLIPLLGVLAAPAGYTLSSVALALVSLIWLWSHSHSRHRQMTFATLAVCVALVLTQSVLAAWDKYWLLQLVIVAVTGLGCLLIFVLRRRGLWKTELDPAESATGTDGRPVTAALAEPPPGEWATRPPN